MSSFLRALSGKGLALGDGAVGTMLQTVGLPLGSVPEVWCLERPRDVARVHAAFAEAGAQWVQTNTFGAARPRLALCGLEHRVAEVNTAAVTCARLGAPDLTLLGAVGPSGATDPGGADGWERTYLEQIEALAEAGVDGFMVETIVCLAEGLAAVRSAVEAGVGPVLAAFTPGPAGKMLDGTTAEAAGQALLRAGAAAVGVNCGAGPESLFGPAARMVALGLGPVLAAPSAGLPLRGAGGLVYPLEADGFAKAAIQFQDLGVLLLAGCCGITPSHLRTAARALSLSEGDSTRDT